MYIELSPYSILMSSGHTTVLNLFYNMASRRVSLVCKWECIAFDEVGGITETSGDVEDYIADENIDLHDISGGIRKIGF